MRPTPGELIERLKEIEGVATDELLAQKLGVGLRAVSRWKAGAGMNYETTVRLLARAGALNWDDDETELDAQVVSLLVELEEVVQRVLSQLRSALVRQAPPQSRGRH